MSMMVSFVLSFFPRDVLDEILNLSRFLRIFLPTLKPQAEEIIAEEHAGFRAGRSTTEQGPVVQN